MKPCWVACAALVAYVQSTGLQAHAIPLQIQNSDKVTSEIIHSPSLCDVNLVWNGIKLICVGNENMFWQIKNVI